jgi:hypothetical protein
MKKVNSPGVYLRYKGKLCEITGYATDKVVFIREVNAQPCKCCGEIKEWAEVESSPNFQEAAEPIKTLEEV